MKKKANTFSAFKMKIFHLNFVQYDGVINHAWFMGK